MSLYLPEALYQALGSAAQAEHLPAVEVARRAIERYVGGTPDERVRAGYRRLRKILGIGEGPGDLARNHDAYTAETAEGGSARRQRAVGRARSTPTAGSRAGRRT